MEKNNKAEEEIILNYSDCEPCMANYPLFMGGKEAKTNVAEEVAKIYSLSSMRPKNEFNHKAYEYILNDSGDLDLKYIAIFEDNKLIQEEPIKLKDKKSNVVLLHELVIDASSNAYLWQKPVTFSFKQADNSFLGIFSKLDTYADESQYVLDSYFLRFLQQGLLECNLIEDQESSHTNELYIVQAVKQGKSYGNYINFLNSYVSMELKQTASQFIFCSIEEHKLLMGENNSFRISNNIEELCSNFGGIISVSVPDFYESFCKNKPDDYRIAGNELVEVTCRDYKDQEDIQLIDANIKFIDEI